jgi:hypothetical protein
MPPSRPALPAWIDTAPPTRSRLRSTRSTLSLPPTGGWRDLFAEVRTAFWACVPRGGGSVRGFAVGLSCTGAARRGPYARLPVVRSRSVPAAAASRAVQDHGCRRASGQAAEDDLPATSLSSRTSSSFSLSSLSLSTSVYVRGAGGVNLLHNALDTLAGAGVRNRAKARDPAAAPPSAGSTSAARPASAPADSSHPSPADPCAAPTRTHQPRITPTSPEHVSLHVHPHPPTCSQTGPRGRSNGALLALGSSNGVHISAP